jgi:hypothetical protein
MVVVCALNLIAAFLLEVIFLLLLRGHDNVHRILFVLDQVQSRAFRDALDAGGIRIGTCRDTPVDGRVLVGVIHSHPDTNNMAFNILQVTRATTVQLYGTDISAASTSGWRWGRAKGTRWRSRKSVMSHTGRWRTIYGNTLGG